MNLLREYIREILTERKLSGRTIEGVLDLLDGYANNTWIFFDTETTGLHPKSAQYLIKLYNDTGHFNHTLPA